MGEHENTDREGGGVQNVGCGTLVGRESRDEIQNADNAPRLRAAAFWLSASAAAVFLGVLGGARRDSNWGTSCPVLHTPQTDRAGVCDGMRQY